MPSKPHDMIKLTGWFSNNVNGMQLEFVYNFSYLAIVLDNKLQFNDHIKNSIKKAGHICYLE